MFVNVICVKVICQFIKSLILNSPTRVANFYSYFKYALELAIKWLPTSKMILVYSRFPLIWRRIGFLISFVFITLTGFITFGHDRNWSISQVSNFGITTHKNIFGLFRCKQTICILYKITTIVF